MLQNFQKTIKESIQLEGVGLHNGLNVNISIKPAEVNSGIVFKRTDVDSSKNLIEADYKNVTSPILCTKIKNSHGVSISTIEHLMAAFYGEGIDNAIVEIDSAEIPIMDGSSFDFVEAIRSVGMEKQNFSRKFIKVLKKVEVKDGSKYISIEPLANDLIIDFEVIYKNPLIRTRRKEFKLSTGNLTTIYNSRTFCLYEDVEKLKKMNLAKGGTLENAIVVKENKILNNEGLRNKKEFVNHKILDCIGDLYQCGYKIIGKVICSQGGHNLTNKLLRSVLENKDNFTVLEIKEKNIPHSLINRKYLRSIA